MQAANPGMCLSAGARFATYLGSIGASHEAVDEFNKNGDHPFYKMIEESFGSKPIAVVSAPSMIEDWQAFYKKFFGLDVDLVGVPVPEGLERTIFIAEGVSINAVVKAHTDHDIPFWKYCSEDLESVIRKAERGPVKASYAIRVRKDQEVDSDLKNLSAEDIASKGIDTENLLERLIHGLKYYDETGKHLDVKNVTLCASSRYAEGYVPRVGHHGDGDVYVSWGDSQGRPPSLRARRAVR